MLLNLSNKDIKLIATDFDGILTDGFVYYSSNNLDELKRVSYKDIMGISIAIKNGYKIAVISGDVSPAIDKIAERFKLEDIHQGIRDKLQVLLSISEKYSAPLANICYLGDDINDIPVLEKVGIAVTVPGANYRVLNIPGIHITKARSGDGAFREVIDSLLFNN